MLELKLILFFIFYSYLLSFNSLSYPSSFSCSSSTCLNIKTCSKIDLAYRQGIYCHGWPWYTGSTPSDFDNTYLPRSYIKCSKYHLTVCLNWDISTGYPRHIKNLYDGSICECNSYRIDNEYEVCLSWTCQSYSIGQCKGGSFDCGNTTEITPNLNYQNDCCWSAFNKKNHYIGVKSTPRRVDFGKKFG